MTEKPRSNSLLLACLALAVIPLAANAEPPTRDGASRVIDGRTHPELLPEDFAWRMAFIHLRILVEEDSRPFDESVGALARYQLHVSKSDVRAVLAVAATTLRHVETIRRAGESGERAIPGQQTATEKRVSVAVIAGRDSLRRQLSPRAYKALEGYVAKVREGSTYVPPE